MDFVDELLGPASAMDRLAEANRLEDRSWVRDLTELRKARSLTRDDVANIMGISVAGVERIEAAPHDLSLSSLQRYALAVEARVHHTVTRAEDEQYVVTYAFPGADVFDAGDEQEIDVVASAASFTVTESPAVFDG